MQSPYFLFSIPPELLHTLTPRNLASQPESTPDTVAQENPVDPSPPPSTGPGCNICLSSFNVLEDQRAHFRSDWHRYNVKLRIKSAPAVSEQEFSKLVDALQDSISGSESSSEDEQQSGSDSDAVSALMKRTKLQTSRPSSPSSQHSIPLTALAWFHSPPSTQLGVYRAIFPTDTLVSDSLSVLRQMQIQPPEGRKWALFMVAGGHFAGAIARVSKAEEDTDDVKSNSRKQRQVKPEVEVLRHKTFHRYTTRRKQGGSQSMNDNAKGPAKSAGAQLRRYGEQALRDDIRNLMTDWADDLNDCERIWIRANTANRRIFLDHDSSILSKGDDRLRTFPFPTRRPTQAEVTRCLNELLRPKISHLTEDILHAQDQAYLASLKPKHQAVPPPQKQPVVKPAPQPKLSKEEETARDRWTRLIEIVQKNRLEALKTFWDREGSSAAFGSIDKIVPDWAPSLERGFTVLQLAAKASSDDILRWLLEDAGADPTLPIPNTSDVGREDTNENGATTARRTAYNLATNRETRNIFRRCAATYPDRWDWLNAARVPSILTKDMEDEQEERKKVKRKGLKEKMKEREAKEREKKPIPPPSAPSPPVTQPPKPANGPQKLGGASSGADGVAGLTPEMRAKIERERRARAAEARLKGPGR